MAQTRACGDGSARAGRMERQRGRALKDESLSGVLKPRDTFHRLPDNDRLSSKKEKGFLQPRYFNRKSVMQLSDRKSAC